MAKIKICIDPGHGGKDPGAMNGNLRESLATMQISRFLGDLLIADGNYEVKFTRTDDQQYPTLTERCNISNSWGAKAFISIHINSAASKSASGIETLRYSKVGETTKKLATNVQEELIKTLKWKDRGVKERDNLTVLKKTNASAILVECGFISHEEESKKLFDCTFQRKLADAIFNGIKKTFGK